MEKRRKWLIILVSLSGLGFLMAAFLSISMIIAWRFFARWFILLFSTYVVLFILSAICLILIIRAFLTDGSRSIMLNRISKISGALVLVLVFSLNIGIRYTGGADYFMSWSGVMQSHLGFLAVFRTFDFPGLIAYMLVLLLLLYATISVLCIKESRKKNIDASDYN